MPLAHNVRPLQPHTNTRVRGKAGQKVTQLRNTPKLFRKKLQTEKPPTRMKGARVTGGQVPPAVFLLLRLAGDGGRRFWCSFRRVPGGCGRRGAGDHVALLHMREGGSGVSKSRSSEASEVPECRSPGAPEVQEFRGHSRPGQLPKGYANYATPTDIRWRQAALPTRFRESIHHPVVCADQACVREASAHPPRRCHARTARLTSQQHATIFPPSDPPGAQCGSAHGAGGKPRKAENGFRGGPGYK